MSEQTKDESQSYEAVYRPIRAFNEKPFDSSAFDYRRFADRVTQALDLFSEGAVLAIDAPWGHGKTYFGTNLNAELEAKGWRTVYIDAFALDFVEDPFLLLASMIKRQAADIATRSGLVKAASAAGKALVPIVSKAAIKAATLGIVDGDRATEAYKAIVDAVGDATEKLIEQRITQFEKDQDSLTAFRAKLAELAGQVKQKTGHPLVIFIDELDRCRPDFAVRTLERMKHLFDAPSLVFVLLLNKRQLENAVNGVYGEALDAEAYLRKFIHLTFELPLRFPKKEGRDSEVGAYPQHLANRINLRDRQTLLRDYAEGMSKLAPAMNLSFRDIERCFTVFIAAALATKISEKLMSYLAFVIALKVAYSNLYNNLLLKSPAAFEEASRLLEAMEARGLKGHLLQALRTTVFAHFDQSVNEKEAANFAEFLRQFDFVELKDFFTILASLIDSRPSRY
jgi:KAP family P-loop domain